MKRNKKIKKRPSETRIAVKETFDKYSSYPSIGLTPQRLATILKQADTGDIYSQMELFEEMEEKDTHLFAQLQTRKLAVSGLEWEIQPFSEDETDIQTAEFVKRQLEAFDNFDEIIIDMLDAIGKGISFLEIYWGQEAEATVIKNIEWVHPKKFFWDSVTDVIKVRTLEHPEGIELGENKFVIHKYKAKSGHPSRAGILRIVSWMYLFKNYDLKDWVSFCEVFGMPLRLGKYDVSASEDDKAALMKAIIELGTDAAGMIPNGTTIDFIEANKTSSVDIFEKLARFCDEQISKAVVGQTLTADSGGGSYAQGKTHNDVRHDLTVADCKALAATIRRDIIRPLVLFNYGQDRRIPIIKFNSEEADDLKELKEVYIGLAEAGLKIPTSHIYKKFAIPKPEAGEEVLRKEAATNDITEVKSLKNNVAGAENRSDELAEAAIKHSEKMFEEMIKPLIELLDKSDSLEEVRNSLEDDKKLSELYKNMETKDFQELLEKALYIAELLGRTV